MIHFCLASTQLLGSIAGIDCVYLINLDRRPDRLQESMEKLQTYNIHPLRFSAIDGTNCSFQALQEMGIVYTQNMLGGRWSKTLTEEGKLKYVWLDTSSFNQQIFSEWMTLGAIGCALSHIAVLKEAYRAGYETIWVLEDDILIKKNPHMLSNYIKKLDILTDRNWDLLYTDYDELGQKPRDASAIHWWMWRPDYPFFSTDALAARNFVSQDFIQIGWRERTHSYILRRSGIRKILDHFKNHKFYLPIDHEIAFAQDLQQFMVRHSVVSYNKLTSSDVQQTDNPIAFSEDKWGKYQRQICANLALFTGWCSQAKALKLMNFIYLHQPSVCVEIGTFGGSTTYPLASALQYIQHGHLYTIDAWDRTCALEGLIPNEINYLWWNSIDFSKILDQFLLQYKKHHLSPWCTILHESSAKSVSYFADESIDLLYIDGNFSQAGSLEDVMLYYPKIKPGGFIWLNDANSPDKLSSVSFLSKQAYFLETESIKNQCVVFQKGKNPGE